jgi:4,4'-diaponeurosporenoate glycosyltransferase
VLTWWFGVGWLLGWWLLWRLDAPGSRGAGLRTGAVSVVIPARDEAISIGALVADLAQSTHRPAQVIVVDDESTDETAALAAGGGAEVLPSGGPPPAWTGKAWACWRGAQAAVSPVLVFLDADVRLAPDALDRLASEHGRGGGGLLSVQPYHVTDRPHEQLSLFFNLIGLMAAGEFTPRRVDARAAFGPCLVCRRLDYLAIGGHAAVRGQVVEDLALARRFRSAGLPVRVAAGRDVVRFRMYPRGLGQLVEGWTKNMAAGAGATAPLRLVAVVVWVGAGVAASILGLGALAGHRPLIGVTAYALAVAQLTWMTHRVGRFRWWAVAGFPGPLAFFLGLFARSVVAEARGTVSWRGRTIAVGRRAGRAPDPTGHRVGER